MKHFYTDGKKTIKLADGEVIPEGFYKGRTFKVNTWNKGLTKDTDERVAKNTAACHRTRKLKNNYHSWNKGLSKENNSSLKVVSEKLSKYRQENPFTEQQLEKMKTNIINTKKKNKSFNSSKPEEEYYQYLLTIYEKDDIIRQYCSKEYPFNCDFYIISLDLYIECNYGWFHGKKPFNPEDPKDLVEYERRLTKSKESKYHKYALSIWTEKDPLKLKTFRDNNLNFMIIYPDNLIITK